MIFFYTCRFLFIRSMWWIPHADANLGKPWWNSRVFPMFFNDLGLPRSNSFLFPMAEIWWNPPCFVVKTMVKTTIFHHFSPLKSPRNLQELRRLRQEVGDPSRRSRGTNTQKKRVKNGWFQHVSTMVFHGEMMVLTMVSTRKWWFHGDWQFNHEQHAGFMGISWGKWSIWWSWPWRKDGDITILAMQGWWLVISWGYKQRWYRGKLMEYLTEYYQPYGVFFIVVSWWFHRESTFFFMARYLGFYGIYGNFTNKVLDYHVDTMVIMVVEI